MANQSDDNNPFTGIAPPTESCSQSAEHIFPDIPPPPEQSIWDAMVDTFHLLIGSEEKATQLIKQEYMPPEEVAQLLNSPPHIIPPAECPDNTPPR